MEHYVEPADDLAQLESEAPPTPSGAEAARGSFNEFDGTFHHENGSRYFPNGNKVDGVNNFLAEMEEEPKKEGEKGWYSVYDGTFHHSNGARYFPDGTKVDGVNLYSQAEPAAGATPKPPAAPATPAAPAPAAAPATPAAPVEASVAAGAPGNSTKDINEFDGTIHKDGKRFFPDGKEVAGVNLNLAEIYSE
jgi:pyruvate/2-oxoglutarate dehydrogenase complex dihydrolipoamide acyltransferase (E2) component